MSGSDIDTRRAVAEGTNVADVLAHNGETPNAYSSSARSGKGGFVMDAAAEKRLLEEFNQSDPRPKQQSAAAATAGVRFNSFRPDMTANTEREAEINKFIADRSTWRSGVPMLRWTEYWRLRADFYPYIKQSDAQSDFFLRGITCHPRLSEFPTCKEVIRDYFVCRDEAKVLSLFNVCAPMKEQLSACINMVFIRNHQRGDKKFNDAREAKFENKREKKFEKLVSNADTSIKTRGGFKD